MKKLCYIAHPFGGDKENLSQVNGIIDLWPRTPEEHPILGHYFPFAPWVPIADNYDDDNPTDRKEAMEANESLFRRTAFDALYIAVPEVMVTEGVKQECHWAVENGIDILTWEQCYEARPEPTTNPLAELVEGNKRLYASMLKIANKQTPPQDLLDAWEEYTASLEALLED